MTLQALFTREGQGSAFLQLCVLGLAAAALLHLSVAVHRRSPALGAVLDVACCLAVAAAASAVLIGAGSTLRLYALLGFLIGALLYAAGVMQLVTAVRSLLTRRKSTSDGKNKQQ